jgi:hypothetical protein
MYRLAVVIYHMVEVRRSTLLQCQVAQPRRPFPQLRIVSVSALSGRASELLEFSCLYGFMLSFSPFRIYIYISNLEHSSQFLHIT